MTKQLISLACLLIFVGTTSHADPTVCPSNELDKTTLEELDERRNRTFEHCLACTGNSCELKSWPKEGAKLAHMCKVFFCTAKKVPKSTFTPIDSGVSGSYEFSYSINARGRVSNIEILTVSGDLTNRQATKLAESTYKRRVFAPVEVDGTVYEIVNLRQSFTFNGGRLNLRVIR